MSAIKLTPPWPIEKPSKNTGYSRAPRNTPATTIVAAWISAETGVGPAMASGSQVCSGNWPLLPMIPMNRQIDAGEQQVVLGAAAERVACWCRRSPNEPTAKKSDDHADHQPDVAGAGREERLDGGAELARSSHQCPISMNEQRPTSSQPTSSWRVLSATTSVSIDAVNRLRHAKY